MLKAIILAFSWRRELTYVASIMLFVCLLPIIGMIVIANTGIQVVSDFLVDVNLQTREIQIYTPSGELYKSLSLSVTFPTAGVITQEFGETLLPYYLFHTGTDIAGKRGDPITPILPGTVVHTGSLSWGLGNHVIVDHGDNITTVYGHMDRVLVQKNDEVMPGTVLGTQGSTGWSTGTHLHLEIRVFGIPVNPRVFLGV